MEGRYQLTEEGSVSLLSPAHVVPPLAQLRLARRRRANPSSGDEELELQRMEQRLELGSHGAGCVGRERGEGERLLARVGRPSSLVDLGC